MVLSEGQAISEHSRCPCEVVLSDMPFFTVWPLR